MPRPRFKRKRGLAPFDAILFDIDNVLVDTRQSYLTAIQKTVEIYLNHPGIVSLKEIDQFKLLGGFNDDWDACFGILTFLQTAIQGKPIRFGDHRRFRHTAWRTRRALWRDRLSISELGELFPERPLGREGLVKRLRTLYERAEIPSFKKIARIFQEVYLGRKFFGRKCLFWNAPGLIEKEKLIFPRPLLEKIRKKGVRLGIVTGRNRFEARYALKRFGVFKFFEVLVTIDDVKREEKKRKTPLRKPHPWPILEAARRFRRGRIKRGQAPFDFLYVGDLPDDILAANRAKRFVKIKAAAFLGLSRNSDSANLEFKKVKPDFFIKKPADLLKILA